MNRRGFIISTAALFCAPAIVRASSLMPVRQWAMSEAECRAWLEAEMGMSMRKYLFQSMESTLIAQPSHEDMDKWSLLTGDNK